jgi:hypothetical protein
MKLNNEGKYDLLTFIGLISYSSTLLLMMMAENWLDVLVLPIFTLSYAFNLKRCIQLPIA